MWNNYSRRSNGVIPMKECYGIYFNESKYCRKCIDLEECGKEWIKKETDEVLQRIKKEAEIFSKDIDRMI